MLRRVFVGCWTFWTGVVSLRAAEPPEVKTGFDLIPINAAGFAVHNLKELQTQGDRFVKNTDMEKHFGIRPSQAIPMIYGYLGLNKGRDDTLPAGIVIANLFESPVLSLSDFQDLEELDDNSKTHASHLQEAFGPDWSKIRLAVHGKKIVVLVGSNGDLFDETLANLDK